MNVTLKGVHLKVDASLREYVDQHLVAPLEHIVVNAAATLDIHLVDINGEKGGTDDKECRATLHIPGLKAVHVTESSDDIFKSVAVARDRLERTAKRELAKRRSTAPLSPPIEDTPADERV